MEGFTVGLALVDAIPVLFFGGSMLLVAGKFGHPLFILGAALSTLAGCCKVAWKLILGIWKRDLRWLNRPFVPMQACGFLLMLAAFVLGMGSISWGGVWQAVSSFPAWLLYALWLAMMGAMVWYRKNRFRNDSAASNWTAQIINAIGQAALFFAVLASG